MEAKRRAISRRSFLSFARYFDILLICFDVLFAFLFRFRLAVTDCSVYNSCDECTGARDPYCGWCSMENR